MENDQIMTKNGTLCFGERKVALSGTIEEKIEQLDRMPFDEFKIAVDAVINASPSCFDDALLNAAVDFFAQGTQIEYCYLLYRMSETEIKRAVERGVDGNAIFDLFNECIYTERKMYELLFKPEVFTEKGIRWMELNVRYNDILYRFLQDGAKNLKMTLDAAKLRPDMANVIKVWLGALG